MEIVNGKVVLGERPCYCVNHPAGKGKAFRFVYCRNHTKAQGWHNCTKKTCKNNKSGQTGWHELSRTIETCFSCKGTGIVPETYCDTVQLPQDFPIRVLRVHRGNTFNENYLGLGTLFSVTDYGSAAKKTDEEVIQEVREYIAHNKGTQAINVVRSKDDLTLCDDLGVTVTRDGYSVRAGWKIPAGLGLGFEKAV